MKKGMAFMLSVLLVLGMTACGNQSESTPGNNSAAGTQSEQNKTEENSSETEENKTPANQAGEFDLQEGTV